MAFRSGADRGTTDADTIPVNIHDLFRKADDNNDRSGGRNLRMPDVVTRRELGRERRNRAAFGVTRRTCSRQCSKNEDE